MNKCNNNEDCKKCNPPCPLKGRMGQCATSERCSHNTNGRDMDKPCSVEVPSHSSEEGWEKIAAKCALDVSKVRSSYGELSAIIFETIKLVHIQAKQEEAREILEQVNGMAIELPGNSAATQDQIISLIRSRIQS